MIKRCASLLGLLVLLAALLLPGGCVLDPTPSPTTTAMPTTGTTTSAEPTTSLPTTSTSPTPNVSSLETLGFSNIQPPVVGQGFTLQIPAAGGMPPYAWTVVFGSLPSGLQLTANGQITGTPTAAGSYSYRLKITDAQGAFAESDYTLNVVESGTPYFTVTFSPWLPYGENQVVGYVPLVQGGKQPWAFTIWGLPAGLTFDPATGLIRGTTTVAEVAAVTISVVDADGVEAIGSPSMISCLVRPPKPTVVEPGKSVYDGTYNGIFAYTYEDDSNPPKTLSGGFRLIVKLAHIGTSDGVTALRVTYASCSDAFFGCQIGGCTPNLGSVATLPADPPTGPFNESQAGMGIVVMFPNGATLVTTNTPGALNVGYNGWMLSNSLLPENKGFTWVANSLNASFMPGAKNLKFTSWSLSWSNVDW